MSTLFHFLLVVSLSASAFGAEFFVAPDGNDANPGSGSKPFATFHRAQQAVRATRKSVPEEAVTVTFRRGTYHLTQTLEFTAEDSGAAALKPVRYVGENGGEVVISGGRRITGWQRDGQHCAGRVPGARYTVVRTTI